VRATLLNRKVHYWTSLLLALPLVVVIASGLLLQTKKHWSWVQPHEQRGTGTVPAVDLPQLLASVSSAPGVTVRGWEDVNRIDVRPGRGVAKVWLNSGWEVQIDLGTGRVMQTAYRRSDLIESIHDGSFFGGTWTKLGIFLPAGLGLLLLWATGVWLLLSPVVARRRTAAVRHGEAVRGAGKALPATQIPE